MNKLEFTNKVLDNLNDSTHEDGRVELYKFIELTNKLYEAINYTHSCKSVKNTDNETPLEKIKVLTNTLETFRNIPYTTDAITKAIKKIDKLISKL